MWSPLVAAGLEESRGPVGGVSAWGAEAAGWDAATALQAAQQLSPTVPRVITGQPEQQLHGQQHSAAAKVYVQGLPQNLQHPVAVASLFSPFGDVLDVKLYAAEVRLSGGSAVVRMRNSGQAAAAITALNGAVPDGGWQQLTVRSAETAEQRSSRISAINGRQQGGGGGAASALGGGPGSPTQLASGLGPGMLPPVGPGGNVMRRVHSARGGPTSSQGLQAYTAGLTASDLQQLGPAQQRRSMDGWGSNLSMSMESSRRSSMDAGPMRGPGRSSSDSGSGGSGGSSSGELSVLAASEAAPLPTPDMQRMLLEAVLALVGQVENGQLSLPAMRLALEAALAASKQAGPGPRVAGGEDASLLLPQGSGGGAGSNTAHRLSPTDFRS